jgi:hypothetical protein
MGQRRVNYHIWFIGKFLLIQNINLVLTKMEQLVQNDLNRTQPLFDPSTFLADLLARYASIELHYGDTEIDDWPRLQDSVVLVYTAVLVYAFEVSRGWRSGLSSLLLSQPALQKSCADQNQSDS